MENELPTQIIFQLLESSNGLTQINTDLNNNNNNAQIDYSAIQPLFSQEQCYSPFLIFLTQWFIRKESLILNQKGQKNELATFIYSKIRSHSNWPIIKAFVSIEDQTLTHLLQSKNRLNEINFELETPQNKSIKILEELIDLNQKITEENATIELPDLLCGTIYLHDLEIAIPVLMNKFLSRLIVKGLDFFRVLHLFLFLPLIPLLKEFYSATQKKTSKITSLSRIPEKDFFSERILVSIFCSFPHLANSFVDQLMNIKQIFFNRFVSQKNGLLKDFLTEKSFDSLEKGLEERARRIFDKLFKFFPPRLLFQIRRQFIQSKIFPALVFKITFQYLHDEVNFFLSFFKEGDETLNYLKTEWNIHSGIYENHRTLFFNQIASETASLFDRNLSLKVMMGLMSLFSLPIDKPSCDLILDFLSKNIQDEMNNDLAVGFILSCRDLTNLISEEYLFNFIQTLISKKKIAEQLSLITILFSKGQNFEILRRTRQIIGFKIPLHTESLNKIGTFLSSKIFPEDKLIQNLFNHDCSLDHLVTIHELFKNKTNWKAPIELSEWFFNLLLQIDTIYEIFIPLAEMVVFNFFDFYIHAEKRFSERKVLEIFDKHQLSLGGEMVLLYFIFYYNQQFFKLRNLFKDKDFLNQPKPYSDECIFSLPIQCHLIQAEKNSQYTAIFPALFSICSSQFPQIFSLPSLLDQLESPTRKPSKKEIFSSDFQVSKEKFAHVERNSNFVSAVLGRWNELPVWECQQQLLPYVSTLLPQLLDSQNNHLLIPFIKLWDKIDLSHSWSFSLTCLNALKSSMFFQAPFTHSQLANDPLLIFTIDSRAFRQAPLFKKILKIIRAYFEAFRSIYSRKPEDTAKTLIITMESAIAQQLLEYCLKSKTGGQSSASDLTEIRELICTTMHESFINNPILCRLVHFQGYLPELLSVTVEHIPSMHICLEFIPDLLGHPQKEKQIFGIQLLSHLAIKYPIPAAFDIAKPAVFNLQNDISMSATFGADQQEEELDDHLFSQILSSLVRLCTAFPSLAEAVIQLLLRKRFISLKIFVYLCL